ncbi:MAG: glycosyltransferase family 4 protein, partial [Candidatus Obscuribacterales bacterium]|nr:glycosyltransferase family 4 protein [Candidatus Obscuribacterales bacterium]
SQATARSLIDAGGNAELVAVVYNGFSVPIPLSDAYLLKKKAELGLAPESKLFGCFSRISPWKGQDILIRAFASINRPDCILIIVGAALFGEEKFEQELFSLSKSLGIENQVKFLGFREDVGELMMLCDLIIQPSVQAEPFGRTIVEAMMAGKPVLSSANGAAREIIEDGRTGFLFTPANAEELSEKLLFTLNNEQKTRMIAAEGQSEALKRFRLSRMQENIDVLIQTARA